ncbi:MAG: cob(I)yrinic acid a,c-diamide adenosyltransferase [Myxococcota bacterium]
MTDDHTFNDPKLAINRVYTRKGDAGTTKLVGGQKVPKNRVRIEAYGTIDELNSFIGAARQTIKEQHAGDEQFEALSSELLRVQHELFNLGSVLATLPEDVVEHMPRVTSVDVEELERSIDHHNEELPGLRSFVLPGGCRLNTDLHLARTVCRRAERLLVSLAQHEDVDDDSMAYVNRLSDALFVWSRWASHAAQVDEVLWQPNMASTARAEVSD